MDVNKTYIFGIGTGRCGTTSLSRILSAQNNCFVSHELAHRHILNWNYNDKDFKLIINEISKYKQGTVGTVAFYLINYIPKIVDYFGIDNVKIIILQRDKDQTVDSYFRWTNRKTPINHWSAESHKHKIYHSSVWDKAYPKYNCTDKKLCISKYYDEYYEICDDIYQNDSYNIKHINTTSLSDDKHLIDLLSWCGFNEPNTNIVRQHHKGFY